MVQYLFPVGFLTAIVGVGYFWLQSWRREQVRTRLAISENADNWEESERPFAKRHPVLCSLFTLCVSAMLVFAVGAPTPIALGVGLVAGLLANELDAWVLEWRQSRIESQLADTIDVLVSSLSSGASLQTALGQAAQYAPQPLRAQLDEMVARLRLGDAPPTVFTGLSQRVPMETFRLFTLTLSVNWEAGGNLSETLSAVGLTIRDRLAIARQIRALSAQGRLTTLIVLAVTWFMAAMMWQADPPRFLRFIQSAVGVWLIAAVMVLQGVGIAMVSKLSRPKV